MKSIKNTRAFLLTFLLMFGLFSSFTAFAAGEPIIVGSFVEDITQTSARPTAEITDEGLAPVIGIWIEYGTTDSYGTEQQRFNLHELTIPGIIDSSLTGLTCDTTYHYRFRARNNALLDGYSLDATFTTLACDDEPISFAGGTGTDLDPYQIDTCEQLQAIQQDLDAYYTLISNIDCAETETWNSNADEWVDGIVGGELIPDEYTGVINNGYYGFEPIGKSNEGEEFLGNFDGRGYTISDVWIFRKNENHVGIFGYATGATVQDVHLQNVRIVGGSSTGGLLGEGTDMYLANITSTDGMVRAYLAYYGGGIAGRLGYQDTLTDSEVVGGNVHGSGNIIGGLVGYVQEANISDSETSADVDGGEYIGGAFGQVYDSIITNVHATGNVTGTYEEDTLLPGFTKNGNYVGGFVGYIYNSEIVNASAIGNVSSEGGIIGGFVGQAFTVDFDDAYALGSVDGVDQVGGFAGELLCGSTVTRAYAQGDVTATGEVAGGFVGSDGCEGPGAFYNQVSAHGNVTATGDFVGGFIGNSNVSDFTDVYASGDVSGNNRVGGFLGEAGHPLIHNAYSRGSVEGVGEDVGGFAGIHWIGGEGRDIYDSFWDSTTTHQSESCGQGSCVGITEKTTSEMRTSATFTDAAWDFEGVWVINTDNDGYPHFEWENPPTEPHELLTLSAINVTDRFAVMRGQIISGTFGSNALGFAFSDASIEIEGEGMGEVELIGPADDYGTIDLDTGIYTLDFNLYFEDREESDGLTCDTTYYYRAIGFTDFADFDSLIISENEFSFETLPCDDVRPTPRRRSSGYSSRALAQEIFANYYHKNNIEIPLPENMCSADQIITQNLRAPSRNGAYNSYTKGIVREINILQAHLNRLGFNSGPIDGIAGPLTDGAIKRMQTFLGAKADGYIGPITRGFLNNSCGTKGNE